MLTVLNCFLILRKQIKHICGLTLITSCQPLVHTLQDPQKRPEDQARGQASSHCSITSFISFPSWCASEPREHWSRAEGTQTLQAIGIQLCNASQNICISSSPKHSFTHPQHQSYSHPPPPGTAFSLQVSTLYSTA